jgi:integrase
LLRQRLHEIDKNDYLARHGKPARVRDLYAALLESSLIRRRGRKRELPGRWRHLEPAFAQMLASALTTDHVRAYVRSRQTAGAADATINRELATLKRMFKLGCECTPPKVLRVPFIPMLTENNVRQGFVEDADFAKLTAEASELWLRVLLELAFTYGWRRGELVTLRVRQVNLALGTIRLDPGTTKNLAGREVAMTAKVRELLAAAVHSKRPDDFVLTRSDGSPIKDFRGAWANLCQRAGLEGLILHDLRRSAAKAARRAGVPESVVMSMGGWKTAEMFRRYAIVSSADQRDAVRMLERSRAEASSSAPLSDPEFQLQANDGKPKVQ